MSSLDSQVVCSNDVAAALWETESISEIKRRIDHDPTFGTTALDSTLARDSVGRIYRVNGETTFAPGWIPTSVHIAERTTGLLGWTTTREPVVKWTYVGDHAFEEAFFEDTIRTCERHPINRHFAFETSVEVLLQQAERIEAMPLTGLLAHMSRCGSTLVAQMLSSLDRCIVFSEPPPIDDVLRLPVAWSDTRRMNVLRALIRVLRRCRRSSTRQVIVKCDSWHVCQFDTLHAAVPDAAWAFLYRTPVEVLVSHERRRGMQMVPGEIDPEWMGLKEEELQHVAPGDLNAYTARVLGQFCKSALAYHRRTPGCLLRYNELPEAVWSRLPSTFGLDLTAADRKRMQLATQTHAKRSHEDFSGDAAEKREASSARLQTLSDEHITPAVTALDRYRQ